MSLMKQTIGEALTITKANRLTTGKYAPRRRNVVLSTAALSAVAALTGTFSSAASAQTTTLFTTTSDFTGWTNNAPSTITSLGPNTTFDFDGSTINGAGNNSSPGGTSTGGSLEINTGSNPLGYGDLAQTPDLSNNQTFLTAFDTGATAGHGTVAFSGNLSLTYTVPTFAGNDVYYQVGIALTYTGNGPFGGGGPFFASNETSDGTVDGFTTVTDIIPYTINASAAGAFNLHLWLNAGTYGAGVSGVNNVATQPIFVDALTVPSPVILPPNNATWGTNGNGTWSTAADWAASAPPNNAQSNATFDTDGGTITTTPTVTLSGVQTVNNLTFNSPKGYVLAGSSVTVGGQLSSEAGTNTIAGLSIGTSTIGVSAGSALNVTSLTHSQYSPMSIAGGGTLNIGTYTDPQGNLEVSGGTTVTFANNSLPSSGAFFYDLTVATANDTVNLGSGNIYDTNSLGGLGTIVIGANSTLTTDEYNGFYFAGALSGSGSLKLGSNAAGAGYEGTFAGASPNYSGAIDAAWTSTVGVANGATLGNGSASNTLTLDSAALQVIGTVALNGTTATPSPAIVNLIQNITIQDLLGLANNTTTINTESDIGYNNNSATLAVGNTLTLAGHISGTNALNKTGLGTLILANSNTYVGATDVTEGTLVVAASGALPANSALFISGGSLAQLATGSGGQKITGLSIDSTSQLDITNNHLFINYSGGSDPISSIAAMIKSGYAHGSWTGKGIISSAAATNNSTPGNLLYGVGYADSADTGNPAGLSSNTIEIAYTLLGDANLSGVVDGTDFGIVAANFNKGVSGWDQGDFNYDNVVDGTDFGDLAANFNKGANGADVGGPAWTDPALVAFAAANGLLADVPEPATLGLLAAGAAGLLARRRRT